MLFIWPSVITLNTLCLLARVLTHCPARPLPPKGPSIILRGREIINVFAVL